MRFAVPERAAVIESAGNVDSAAAVERDCLADAAELFRPDEIAARVHFRNVTAETRFILRRSAFVFGQNNRAERHRIEKVAGHKNFARRIDRDLRRADGGGVADVFRQKIDTVRVELGDKRIG